MRPSLMVKKFISVAALGLIALIAMSSITFFAYMGYEFGYRDLQCNQFTETRKFASEFMFALYNLDNSADFVKNYEEHMTTGGVYLTEAQYTDSEIRYGDMQYYRVEDWLNSGEYYFNANQYGIVDLYSANEGYNDSWYGVTLDPMLLRTQQSFTVISREDYIELLLNYAEPNATVVDDFSEEDFRYFVTGEEYAESKLTTSTETTENYEDTTTEAADYIDNSFSPNSYIGYYDGVMLVYSPEENMFYSSLYGWYTVPEKLYFLTNDVQACTGVDLFLYKFASEETLFKEKVGEDYLYYLQEMKNLSYTGRNIMYYVKSDGQIYTNGSREKIEACNQYFCIKPTASGEYTVDFHNFENVYMSDEFVTGLMQTMNALKPDDTLYVGVFTTYPHPDSFATGYAMFHEGYPLTIPMLVVGIITTIVSLLWFARVIWTSGRVSKEDKTIYLLFWEKLPVELFVVALPISIIVMGMIWWEVMAALFNYYATYIEMVPLIYVACYAIFMTSLLSLIRRGKAKVLLDKSLIRWTWGLLKRAMIALSRQKNLVARAIELFAMYWLVMLIGVFFLLMDGNGWCFLLGVGILIAVNIGALVVMVVQAKGEQNVREATKALADGDLEYRVKPMKRLGTEQEIIDNINHLSDGLHKAVEKSISDERMKAELITNVSHDIKTPLTSIINYVDLIKKEKIEDETMIHYIEVLDQKSQRLKQLTEDLVEVSKISTGNIELERVPIDFGELLRQALGEFGDKFAEQELQVVDNIQEQSYMVFADGRRTFRILENLFQNIYKYAMPNTRVYIDLKNEQGRIVLSVKNISRAPLNIDASELMERFVRGDQSRTTEGSGLGLSIAQDLVKLQEGDFEIYLDGDLFKVVVTFPEYVDTKMIDMEESNEVLDK